MSLGNPCPLVWAMLRRNRFSSILFIIVIALAVALGIAVSAQERALRQGSNRAADRFDLIVAAPGSQIDLLFSVVYLDATAVELLTPAITATVLADNRVDFAAPIGFGDSIHGDPVIGTIAGFVEHLSDGLAEGKTFAAIDQAVVGALSPHQVGDRLQVSHGQSEHGEDADDYVDTVDADHDHAHAENDHAHEGHGDLLVVGRMHPTGTPWDRAIITPIEYNWIAHGLGTGHAAGDTRIGPPFDTTTVPGVPAIVLKPQTVAASYGLRSLYRSQSSTAFFPAEVLVNLYAVMGDLGRIMAGLTLAAQVLVIAAILAGLMALLDLQRQRFAVLRALGAPRHFIFTIVWSYIVGLIGAGAALGLIGGYGLAAIVSQLVARQTGIAMFASIGGAEMAMVGALLLFGIIVAAVPALLIYRRPVAEALRS